MRGLLLKWRNIYFEKNVLFQQYVLYFEQVLETWIYFCLLTVLVYLNYVHCVVLEKRLPTLGTYDIHSVEFRLLD
jgi:hypothetical protein